MNAFARGARTGVRIGLVKRRGELAVAVTDQKPNRLRPIDKRLDVARLLGRPVTRRVRSDARQLDVSGCEFDEHECVQPPKQHGVDGEEVASDDSARLGPQKLAPCLR
jgi:hypothetical protein